MNTNNVNNRKQSIRYWLVEITLTSGDIIVFSERLSHNEFENFDPMTAGFISFGQNHSRQMVCSCFGRSTTLKLESNEQVDTILAMRQILGYDLFEIDELLKEK